MPLRELLSGVAALGYDAALGAQQPAQQHLRAVRAGLAGMLPPSGLEVRVSGAAVNLPQIPWIAVLNPEVTRTAQAGLYVVFLYSAALDRVYLTMNQGATAHREHAQRSRPPGMTIDQAAVAELTAESAAIREELPKSLLAGTSSAIDLGASGFLPIAYEAGTIASTAYDVSALPPEGVLRADLGRFLQIYDAAVEARQRLTAADPARFYTPAMANPPKPGSEAELFRPKDASEYVAQIVAHTQVRSRRHEAVVKAFGHHALSMGWKPATNVHPRDLVLRRTGDELLCEVKVVKANAEIAVREAIGQLFTYRHLLYTASQPPAGLLAVFSDPVGEAFVDLLEQLGLASVWSEGGDSWQGSTSAVAWGLI